MVPLLSEGSSEVRREAEGVTFPWFEVSPRARLTGLRDVPLIRGEERRAAVRRRTGLLFLPVAGCCCSARGDAGASKLELASLGVVGVGLKALEMARGEIGGELALVTGNRDFEGEYDRDRLILFIDEKLSL